MYHNIQVTVSKGKNETKKQKKKKKTTHKAFTIKIKSNYKPFGRRCLNFAVKKV
jgi:hypothetical protein